MTETLKTQVENVVAGISSSSLKSLMELFERMHTIRTRPNTDVLSKKLDKVLDKKMEQFATEKKRCKKEQDKLD